MLTKILNWLFGFPVIDLRLTGVGVGDNNGVPCLSLGQLVSDMDPSRDIQIDAQVMIEIPDLQTLERLQWAITNMRALHWPDSVADVGLSRLQQAAVPNKDLVTLLYGIVKEGADCRDRPIERNPYPGNSVAGLLHAQGWLIRDLQLALTDPVKMILHCPECHTQHIDGYEPSQGDGDAWLNPEHRSHRCSKCGTVWRPSDRATEGVASIATSGKNDTWKGK